MLAAGPNVNILVLDTEVYSNTGGQASKATPLGASAKFAAAGKRVPRKDLALMAIAYGNVYVAQIAMGANNEQALVAMREAEAYPGPSLILAYSQCIAHGIDMRHGMKQAARAVASGYWPLFRFDPTMRVRREPVPARQPRPRIPLEEYRYNEVRFKSLAQGDPRTRQSGCSSSRSAAVEERYRVYEDLASRDGSRFLPNWGAEARHDTSRYLGLQLAHPIWRRRRRSPPRSTACAARGRRRGRGRDVVALRERSARRIRPRRWSTRSTGRTASPRRAHIFPSSRTTTVGCRDISRRCGVRQRRSRSR